MKRRTVLTFSLLLLVGTCSSILYKMHRKVVTNGEYLGFVVGSTKKDVLAIAIERAWGGTIKAGLIDPITIKRGNTERLSELLERDGIVIHYSGGGQTLIYSDEGEIQTITNSAIGPRVGSWAIRNADLQEFITLGLENEEIADAQSTLKGYSYDFRETSVQTDGSSKATDWLMSQNYWRFDGKESWTEFRLFFENGRLSKIVHLDYFAELP